LREGRNGSEQRKREQKKREYGKDEIKTPHMNLRWKIKNHQGSALVAGG
jgi:hypothetical protein